MTGMGVPPAVRIQVLGRFAVLFNGKAVRVGGPTAQAVLVALLDRRTQIKLAADLVHAVWGRSEAVSDESLYHYISKLRKALRETGVRIDSCWPGYRLALPAGAVVDAERFAALLEEVQTLRREAPERAVRALREALDLWQDEPPLAGLGQPGARQLAARLTGQRLAAAGLLGELELAAGRPDQVLVRVRSLALSHVDSGGPVGAVLRALHATGRTDEAMSLLRQAEQAARLHERGLPESVRLAREAMLTATAVPPPATGPYQLPADTTHFTGRRSELARLRALWPADGLVVAALDGMAGIGKTALAVHWAHELAPRFPDGNLFVDLHGYTPRSRPTPPERALDLLLRGLGVPTAQIPRDLQARAALYRTRLTGRRMLIVLDNAEDEAQLLPLLPGSPGSLVIVTSRRRLSGVDDAHHLTLQALPPQDAAALFRKVAAGKVAGDHQVVDQIVGACGELPLAIRIAAARLRTSRALSPSTLLGFLRSGREEQTLAGLDDGARSVRAAFEVSYRHLSAGQRHAFRLLGAHPGATFDGYAAAALLGAEPAQAGQILDALEQVNLLSQPAPGRYGFHDLLRTYATGLPAEYGDGDAVPRALTRLFDHYRYATATAMDALYPYERAFRPAIADPGSAVPPDAHDDAAAWLQEELPTLLAAPPGHVVDLSALLARHLRTQVRYAEGRALHTAALEIARAGSDELAELAALLAIGRNEEVSGHHAAAARAHGSALAIATRLEHAHGQISALNGLGHVSRMTTRDEPALGYYGRALELAVRHRHAIGRIDAYWGLGRLRIRAGQRQQARRDFAAALRLALEIGHHGGVIRARTALGQLYRCTGDLTRAARYLTSALQLALEVGDLSGEVHGLCGLGDVARQQHHFGSAGQRYRHALERARDGADRTGQCEALHGLGRTLYAAGQPGAALDCHRQALALATDLGQPHDQARAHDSIARSYLDLGHHARARAHWEEALAILRTLDAPGAADITRELTALA
jgi:tetratricopeptide (TPR) repeat protein/DNA-binding SARP family transcriptional activator